MRFASVKKKAMLLLTALLLLPAAGLAANADLPMPKYRDVALHDPSVLVEEDGTVYVFGSHMQAAKTTDLIRWQLISKDAQTGCTLVENVQEEMKEALRFAKTNTFWAPDVFRLRGGRYAMYYCTCEGSSPLSCLGLAIADTPEGPYRNQGVFLRSGEADYDATELPNVIDPCVFTDAEDQMWMVYGSYSGGIFILRMDPDTGLPLEGQGYGKKLLGGNHARIEAPYILYAPETGYYYLFLSFGGLNAADGYNIRVCRSRAPDGPYLDALGQDMIDCKGKPGTFFNDPDYEGYGVKLMGGYCFEPLETDHNRARQAFRSPGHNSAFLEEKTGRYFILFHTRFASRGETYSLRVHQMMMNEEGWPVILPMRYAGEAPEAVAPEKQAGEYKVVFHERDINLTEHTSVLVTLNADGTISGGRTGTWSCPDGTTFRCEIDGSAYTGRMTTVLDKREGVCVPCFTTLDAAGAALWGLGVSAR